MQEISERPSEGVAHAELDSLLESVRKHFRSDPGQGLTLARRAEQIAVERGLVYPQAQALVYAANCYHYMGRHKDMLPLLQEASRLFDKLGDHPKRPSLLYVYGIYYIEEHDLPQAYACFNEILSIRERLPDPASEGTALIGLGKVYLLASDFEKALTNYFKGLEIWEDLQAKDNMAVAHNNIGNAYLILQEVDKALAHFDQALELHTARGNISGMAHVLLNLGNAYSDLQALEPAQAAYEQALGHWRRLDNRPRIAWTLHSLARLHTERGQLMQAIQLEQEALALADRDGQAEYRVDMLLHLGSAYRSNSETGKADETLHEALDLAEELQIPWYQYQIQEELALLAAEQEDFAAAYRFQRKSAQLYEQVLGAERRKAVAELERRMALQQFEKDQEILRLEAAKVEQELEATTKELSQALLSLTHRNEALLSLRQMVDPYARDARGALKRLTHDLLARIDEIVETRDDWIVFDQQFERANRDFIGKIRELSKLLTPTEIKICVLIRLNLSTKQIADVLFSSIYTVKTHRTKIRKKLGLTNADNLGSFLLTL